MGEFVRSTVSAAGGSVVNAPVSFELSISSGEHGQRPYEWDRAIHDVCEFVVCQSFEPCHLFRRKWREVGRAKTQS
jgi:hypothetical protein